MTICWKPVRLFIHERIARNGLTLHLFAGQILPILCQIGTTEQKT
ncbi:hypothetical protein Pan54_12670 [Rubinisphaera italica]|uniref:Uncharacterized protein n=1 Tax=Rubinisphaera italica TaxID=2527969 RepID=A0A5C5XE23_9PLAN|nr:hypothetical protein Pan54_12670 [Rubinisphaera italica]